MESAGEGRSRTGIGGAWAPDSAGAGRSVSAQTRSDAEAGSALLAFALAAVSIWTIYEAFTVVASAFAVPTRADVLHFLGVPPNVLFF